MSDYNSSLPIRTENNGDAKVSIVDINTPSQGLNIDANGKVTVKLNDKDGNGIASTNEALKVALNDEAGNAFTEANPLPVFVSESAGVEVHDYDAASAIAANASANHDYTTGAEFDLKQVLCSASGKAKFELQVETAPSSNVFNTIAVQFNSTANPNCDFELKVPVVVQSGAKVRVIKTNKDNQAQDLYSVIIGVE